MNSSTIHDISTIQVERPPLTANVQNQSLGTKGFWPRTTSYILDYMIYLMFFLLAGVSVGLILGTIDMIFGWQIMENEIEPFSEEIVGLTIFVIYFSIFEWLFGATPGKALLRMRVVGPKGERVSLIRCLVRGAARLIDALFLGLVAAINMRGPLKQRWGDKLAYTIVVDARDPIIQFHRSKWWLLAAVGLNWLSASCALIAFYVATYLFG